MGNIRRPLPVIRRTGQRRVVLHEHAVVQHGDARRMQKLSATIKTWSVENDFIGLPLAWGQACVYKRRKLPVDAAAWPSA
jgi:hypothetical protein